MATSRPLPPGRRGTGARPPAVAMRTLPEPRLLSAPPAPAFPAKEAPKPIEQRQEQPPSSASHDVASIASAPARLWEKRAPQPTAVAKLSDQPAQPVRKEATAPYPAPATPPKASGFLAARAMFDAKKTAPSPPAPPAKPSRFNAPPPSIVTSSSARAQTTWSSTPKSPASVPEPPAEQAPSSVKALISRLNSPAAVAKTVKPSTEHARPSPQFPRVAAVGSPRPEQRAPPPPSTPEATTPAVKHVPTPEPVVSIVKPAAAVKPVAPTISSPVAWHFSPSVSAPAPRAVAPPPVAVSQARPTVVTPPAVAPSAPPTVATPIITVMTPAAVLPPPTVVLPPAHSPVATDSMANPPEFHPFNLLLPVTAVPTIPRKLDCVYDDAAAEMQKNIMKVVKKIFRKNKPRVEEFKINAKLYGNGFMDAEEYLDSLIKDFRALRALQLVPCLVSIQPDSVKRENLLYAARGYRLRNMDALQGQCEQSTTVEQCPRLSSSESIASTVSTVSTVSVAAVDPTMSVIAKNHDQEKNSIVASEPVAAAVDVFSTKQSKPDPIPVTPEQQEAVLFKFDSSHIDVKSSASEHEAKGNNTGDISSSTATEPLSAPEPVSEPVALLVSESPEESFSKVEPDQQINLSPEMEVVVNNHNEDRTTGSADDTPASLLAKVASDGPAAAEVDCGATKSVEAEAENALSEADTDSDSSTADPVTSVDEAAPVVTPSDSITPPVHNANAQDEVAQSPRDSNQEQPPHSTSQRAEPEAGLSTDEETVTPEKPEPQVELVEPPVKSPPDAVATSRPSRADSLTSSDDEEEEAPANAFQRNIFGEVVTPKEHEPKQPVGSTGAVQPNDAAVDTASSPVKYYEAESLFGGSYEPVVAVQTTATAITSVDTDDAFTLFGPPSPARSPSNAATQQLASSSKLRKSVTWGGTQAKEIPARKASPPAAPMIFGFATAGAYSDSDSDSDSDFD